MTGFGLRVSGVGINAGEPVAGLIIGSWLGLEVGVVWLTGLAVAEDGFRVSGTGGTIGTSTGESVAGPIVGGLLGLEVNFAIV
jgi:hypothetical protein